MEKGYKKRSSWKVFGKTSAMDPILTILRMNCKEQERLDLGRSCLFQC